MIKELMHDPIFLAGKSAVATKEDLQVAKDLLDTLIAHRESCVGMAAKPPKATSWQSRASAGDRQRLCDGGGRLERICKSIRRGNFQPRIQAWYENRN